ncbi:hypothetical protein DR64_1121 [Paraburkholderia xenovorans LB400]|nr:hypothetical protein DR64_1121 [Paraburkholderia xenovorans LB400]
MTRLNTTAPRASVAICKGRSRRCYMIEARNRPHPKRDRDEFTSEENTTYTWLNMPVRRVPCWRRIRGANENAGERACDQTRGTAASAPREKCASKPIRHSTKSDRFNRRVMRGAGCNSSSGEAEAMHVNVQSLALDALHVKYKRIHGSSPPAVPRRGRFSEALRGSARLIGRPARHASFLFGQTIAHCARKTARAASLRPWPRRVARPPHAARYERSRSPRARR